LAEERITLLAVEPITISEVRSPPRVTAPTHVHSDLGTGFHALAGELAFRFDDGDVRAGQDTWVFVPPNVAHAVFASGDGAHFLERFHDIVFVVDGTLEVVIGDESAVVGQGAFALASPDVPHTFSNPTDAPLRLLNLYVPGGFERFFRERAAATPDPTELTSRYDWERA
jgi:mannose-6-phosphate isomerase-like protein (cupin superfamily)